MSSLDIDVTDTQSGTRPKVRPARNGGTGEHAALYGYCTLDTKRAATIEIVIAPHQADVAAHRKNVGIELDEVLIQKILSSRYRHIRITQIDTLTDLEQIAARGPDLVFSGVKFFTFDGEDLWLNDFLDLHGIAYIASGKSALDKEHDKACAKSIVSRANVATAKFFLTAPGDHPTAESIPLSFPLFVKPVKGGDSRGVDANSVVLDFESFQRKVQEIQESLNSSAMVETYLSGREYSVGIFEDASSGTLRAMPIEIITEPNKNGDRILDYDVKKQDAETVAPVTDQTVRMQLNDLAKAAFRALDGRSFGRIDIKMSQEGVPHFIEANLMPGLRKGYFYRSCMLNLGMDYEAMILTIAENGLASRIDDFERIKNRPGEEMSIRKTLNAAYWGMSEPEFRVTQFAPARNSAQGHEE